MRLLSRIALAVGLIIALPSGRAWAWQTSLDPAQSYAKAVAVDAVGDVIAVGTFGGEVAGAMGVAKLSGATGNEIWRREIHGTGNGGFAWAVATLANGDAIAAGSAVNVGTAGDVMVVRLAGATGEELWRQTFAGTAVPSENPFFEAATDLALDGDGNVVVVGTLENAVTLNSLEAPDSFFVAKLVVATGAVLWRREVSGVGDWFPNAHADAVAVDGAGNVVVSGQTQNNDVGGVFSGRDFTVVKFAGADGSELWRNGMDDLFSVDGEAQDVAVDANGDVVATGVVAQSSQFATFTVRKLAGTTGAILWQRSVDPVSYSGGEGFAVAVDPAGDVVAAGQTGGWDSYTVLKVAGSTGAELWRYQEPALSVYGAASANTVAVDAHGDVFASGTAIVKLAGATGAVLWRRGGTLGATWATGLAFDGPGNLVVAAYDFDPPAGFTVQKLFGSTGGTFPCGDGVLDTIDQCDDGNLVDGDGCDSNCTPTACANGIVTAPEGCDDGDVVAGDGCDPVCSIEPGWRCERQPSRCREICGDGVHTAGEGCDDGNLIDGDGCDSNCTVTACGNGVRTSGETCDDGNLVDNDGCNADCEPSRCGDGLVAPWEGCDDGNLVDGDGCDSNCTPTGCGNDARSAGEECDDGNVEDRDGCTPDCRLQCNPYNGNACAKRFAFARALQADVLLDDAASALAAVGTAVAVGDVYGGRTRLFDADPSAASFGALLRTLPLPAGGGQLGTIGAHFLVGRPGAVHELDAAGNPVRKLAVPGGKNASALAGSGDRVVVGVAEAKVVHVYDASGARLATLVPPSGDTGNFGAAIAIAGGTIAVGSPDACPAAVHLYDLATAAWVRSLTSPDPYVGSCAPYTKDQFGVAIAAVGNRFVIGDPPGAAYLFETSGALVQTFLRPARLHGAFGISVAALGANVLVGMQIRGEYYLNGAAYLFDAASGDLLWPFRNPSFNEYEDEEFGRLLAVVGGNVVIGDRRDNTDASGWWGTAYLFIDTTHCGDGAVDPTEQCDDGNQTSGDGCDSNCTTMGCGNAVATDGEECDDGDRVSGDDCDANCTDTGCGNGIATPMTWRLSEDCDDANDVDGDGCSSCARDTGWVCGGSPSVCAPCGGGLARVERPRVVVRHVDSSAQVYDLTLAADVVLPEVDSALDPAAHGMHIAIEGKFRSLIDVALPGGSSLDGAWKTLGGRRWLYRGATQSARAITVAVAAKPAGGRVKVRLKATGGNFELHDSELPLQVLVVLDPVHVATGQCGDIVLPTAEVRCRAAAKGRRFECR